MSIYTPSTLIRIYIHKYVKTKKAFLMTKSHCSTLINAPKKKGMAKSALVELFLSP